MSSTTRLLIYAAPHPAIPFRLTLLSNYLRCFWKRLQSAGFLLINDIILRRSCSRKMHWENCAKCDGGGRLGWFTTGSSWKTLFRQELNCCSQFSSH